MYINNAQNTRNALAGTFFSICAEDAGMYPVNLTCDYLPDSSGFSRGPCRRLSAGLFRLFPRTLPAIICRTLPAFPADLTGDYLPDSSGFYLANSSSFNPGFLSSTMPTDQLFTNRRSGRIFRSTILFMSEVPTMFSTFVSSGFAIQRIYS